ncbi:MAG: 16S rRNA (cytidine(1402)-2'-O)-methyltransferase [Candidatus Binatia bacterium]
MAGTLYIVASPIGNLEDITLRALRVLKEVDLIAAEDTRHTKKLLAHYGIATPLTSYHQHNEIAKSASLVQRLNSGCRVALISDAGTPIVSDPGFRLVQGAIHAGIPVVPIPGPSALTAVLSASGLPSERFVFEGFLPARKSQRRERLRILREEPRTLVFYEVPHRVEESLQDLLEVLGEREMVLGREMTKLHEEFIRGSVSELAGQAKVKEWRGEMTLVVEGKKDRDSDIDRERERERGLKTEIKKLRKEGMRVKEIAELLGERFSLSKREVYRMVLEGEGRNESRT